MLRQPLNLGCDLLRYELGYRPTTPVALLASTTNRLQRLTTAGRPPCRPQGLTSLAPTSVLRRPAPQIHRSGPVPFHASEVAGIYLQVAGPRKTGGTKSGSARKFFPGQAGLTVDGPVRLDPHDRCRRRR